MSYNNTEHALTFAALLPNMIKLNELQKITENLDQELADSQKMMKQIKTMFDTAAKVTDTKQGFDLKLQQQRENPITHDTKSAFLKSGVPKLLMSDMPDMPENSVEDLDRVVATMRGYAEELRNKITINQLEACSGQQQIENLDMQQYAASFDQLAKCMANMKLDKDEVNNKNLDLEVKMSQLCQDVHLFTQMVEAKTAISESNQNVSKIQEETEQRNALYYDEIINKLLNGINEVAYLLKRQN